MYVNICIGTCRYTSLIIELDLHLHRWNRHCLFPVAGVHTENQQAARSMHGSQLVLHSRYPPMDDSHTGLMNHSPKAGMVFMVGLNLPQTAIWWLLSMCTSLVEGPICTSLIEGPTQDPTLQPLITSALHIELNILCT